LKDHVVTESAKKERKKRKSKRTIRKRKQDLNKNYDKRRSAEEYVVSYREKDRANKEHSRSFNAFKTPEQERNTIAHRRYRSQDKSGDKIRENDQIRKESQRLNEEWREIERLLDAEARAESRNDAVYRENERKRDKVARAASRTDETYRKNEREKVNEARNEKRQDQQYRENESERDNTSRSTRRLDFEYRESENKRDAESKYSRRNNPDKINLDYERCVNEGPTHVCACCGGMFFSRSVDLFHPDTIKNDVFRQLVFNEKLYDTYNFPRDRIYACKTCKRGIDSNCVPRIALSKGLEFNDVHEHLKELNDTEERLVSPRIAFMRIRSLGWDGQKGMIGNVVNVPIDLKESFQGILPRRFDNTYTMQLRLMRKQVYKNAYKTDEICPFKVIRALKLLVDSEVFKLKQIQVDTNWLSEYDEKIQLNNPNFRCPFIVDDNDEEYINNLQREWASQQVPTPFNDVQSLEEQLESANATLNSSLTKSLSIAVSTPNTKSKTGSTFESDYTTPDTPKVRSQVYSTKTTVDSLTSSSQISSIGDSLRGYGMSKDERRLLMIEIDKRYARDESDDSGDSDAEEGKADYFAANNRYTKHQNTLLDKDENPQGMADSVNVAPAEENTPDFFVDDPYAEELQFIKIYGGEARKYPPELSYQMICKSEFRRYDTRCAESIEKIFYSYKWLTTVKLRQAINTALKRKQLFMDDGQEKNITAGMVKDKEQMKALYEDNQALTFMRAVRSTPQFWEWKKFELNAMIRQLGCPSWFITFSPSEINWPELVVILAYISEKKVITVDEVDTVYTRQEKIELVNKNPIIVTRYFENRMRALLKFLLSRNGVFYKYPVTDYFWRVDFQYRGAPHVHMLVWCKGHPTYSALLDDKPKEKKEMMKKYAEFVAEYCTCERPEDDIVREDKIIIGDRVKEVSINFQKHSHRKNCKMVDTKGNVCCKYHYPMPLLERPYVIEPFDKDQANGLELYSKGYDTYIRIKLELDIVVQQTIKDPTFTIDLKTFLKERLNDLSFEDYIFALSCSIKKITVFLPRTSRELMINQYVKKVYVKHRANMDCQPVTDAYGCAVYVSAYMLKNNLTLSNLLKKVQKESEEGNLTVRNKLTKAASAFQNSHEVSGPEATYTLMSMPVSHASRETVYINTYPSTQRMNMLMDKEMLEFMQDDSSDIWKKNLLIHYKNRPLIMEEMCLAEFAAWYSYHTNAGLSKATGKRKVVPEKEEDENDDDEFDDYFFENQVLEQNPLDREFLRQQKRNQRANNDNGAESSSDSDVNSEEEEERLKNYKADKRNYIRLRENDGYVLKRRAARIIRYKRYKLRSDPANFYRVQIMLYSPWRNDVKELESPKTVQDMKLLWEEKYIYIESNRKMFEVGDIDTVEDIQQDVEETMNREREKDVEKELEKRAAVFRYYKRLRKQEARKANINNPDYDDNDDDDEQEDDDLLHEYYKGGISLEQIENEYGYFADIPDFTETVNYASENDRTLNYPKRITNHMYFNTMRALNERQQIYLMNFLTDLKSGEPFFHFVRGGAGTGKSHLIKAIYQTTIRYFQPMRDLEQNQLMDHSDLDLWCVVGAFTGKAAFNISGDTLVRLFKLPVKQTVDKFKDSLGAARKEMEKQYEKLKLIIVDEISMVGAITFEKCNSRMQSLRGNTKCLMGGLPMIVFGDFNQLPPIKDNLIFKGTSLNAITNLVDNPSWINFKMWELTEIMRQTGSQKDFAIALNKIGEDGPVGLKDQQISLFNTRIVTQEETIPARAIFLFHTNKLVNDRNFRKISSMPGEEYICTAIDSLVGKNADMPKAKAELEKAKTKLIDDTNGMPYELKLKIGCKYMITSNIDVEDGLVNGCSGILMNVVPRLQEDYHTNHKILKYKRLWFDFIDPNIGAKARNKKDNQKYFQSDILITDRAQLVSSNWTPFDYNESVIHVSNILDLYFKIERIQYQLVPCESLTIHKSQGQTYTSVALGLDKAMTNALLYVGLSRVTTLNELYLIKDISILPEKYRNMSKNQKKKVVDEYNKTNPVKIQMNTLRTTLSRQMINRYPFMCSDYRPLINENNFTIMFQNIQSWSSPKMAMLKADRGFQNSDLIMFVSTCLKPGYRGDTMWPSYEKIYHTHSPHYSHSNGMLAFLKDNKRTFARIMAHNADPNSFSFERETSDTTEICVFKYKTRHDLSIFICVLYNHPQSIFVNLIKRVQHALVEAGYIDDWESGSKRGSKKGLIIVGDFNIDFNKAPKTLMDFETNLMVKVDKTIMDKPTRMTPDGTKSQIDWLFHNFEETTRLRITTHVYESWLSDHKPIFAHIIIEGNFQRNQKK
jgi:hypothetical protein